MIHALHTKWVLSAMVQYASEYELLRHGLTAGSDHQHPIVLLHRRIRVIFYFNFFRKYISQIDLKKLILFLNLVKDATSLGGLTVHMD
jgi:hypothetical protein